MQSCWKLRYFKHFLESKSLVLTTMQTFFAVPVHECRIFILNQLRVTLISHYHKWDVYACRLNHSDHWEIDVRTHARGFSLLSFQSQLDIKSSSLLLSQRRKCIRTFLLCCKNNIKCQIKAKRTYACIHVAYQ